jgi:pyruvate decarboxylase
MTSIKIGEHILQRLKEVGVDTVFGVPGDYNMVSIIFYPFLR